MPIPEFVPEYLRPFIAKQDPSLYTPIDHASWRFILRTSKDYFAKSAHQKYLSGLEETGISTERIPLVEEMDARLKKFGWRAVAVSGFIPPAVFMEFQSLGILPIACEMRTLEHLAYTPAPDIVHEAAGHAPIIADPDYAAYLRAYGEVSRKAIFSYQDMAVYEAIRNLSIVKEDPKSTSADIARAQKQLDETVASVTFVSEAALMARMNWWTVEYGLIGSMDNPKIYGAGLLSSLGESYSCLRPGVKHLPLSLDCVKVAYDITKPQPQLFVARDFDQLTEVLNEFAEQMAYRRGGTYGLDRAIEARTVCTIVLDSEIQFSGVVSEYRKDRSGGLSYIRLQGPTQLAMDDQELPGHGPDYHRDGYSTVLGLLQSPEKCICELDDSELRALEKNGRTKLVYQNGFTVDGIVKGALRKNGKLAVLSFEDCTVRFGEEILFRPEWGTYDLACGSEVLSVFGGAADRKSYLSKTGGFQQLPMHPKSNLTPENRELNTIYQKIRDLREKGTGVAQSELLVLAEQLDRTYPEDWLSRIELLELKPEPALARRLRDRLDQIKKRSKDQEEMIDRGLRVLGHLS